MKIIKSKAALQALIQQYRSEGATIGFVPTMGALHDGHVSLIQTAKTKNRIIICSIFVNPTQFNDPKDFEKYPVTVERDIELLTTVGCDLLFLPDVTEMYPEGTAGLEAYALGYIETVLDGASRPGHFQGVAQVVSRLIDAVGPDDLYMGQKDYQQCMVIKRLMALRGDAFQIHFVPTKREADGLAMSSRNRRLTESQRALAGTIYQCLISIEAQNNQKSFSIVQKECLDLLTHKGFRPDYVMLADADTLELLEDYDASRNMIALVAAFIGEVRLIDNLLFKK
ncbi:pantoate--beta-alanine ligase [Taibaiella sp. KBW10]|uniref:pantoate--beta-alanine ligase n=1 Tax=Taibaiella sp. KBW10 TaxID=2153357 RepID=UPI000F5A438F|nr:pantoate--beta-alanine ligase [Taibaiella sp. KBW10]RQO31511.1 pantoate--beta-alanine ligase [Taibaiella sp. KBW10]